jgi:hypothetical protein
MRILFTLLLIVSTSCLFAQKELEVLASYSMELPKNITMEQLEQRCIEQARLKAIGDSLGYILHETTISNTQEGNAGLNSSFAVLTQTNVQGEWLQNLADPVIIWEVANLTLKVTATVHGIIREFPKSGKVDIAISLSNDENMTNEVTEFKDGQDLFASFQTSSKGFLSVYYIDHSSNEVYRLIPAASRNDLNVVEVKSDIPYPLFQSVSPFTENKSIPALSLSLPEGKEIQLDELVFVYSPTAIRKPSLSYKSDARMYFMKHSDFDNWKSSTAQADPDVVVKTVSITIVK